MNLPRGYKEQVAHALIEQRANYGGSDAAYARLMEINVSVFSRIKSQIKDEGDLEKLVSNSQWVALGRKVGVTLRQTNWVPVETDVFVMIKEDIMFCKNYSKSRIFVDNCGIGKTFAAKYIAKREKNVFYIDATQCNTKIELIKAMARAVGLEVRCRSKLKDLKADTKYYLSSVLDRPVMIIDEAGALDKDALGIIQEYWNATEDFCGWYLMGANALRSKIERGVSNDRAYFAELFSRFSEKFSKIVPKDEASRITFYKKLISDVLSANMQDKSNLNHLVNQCLIVDKETGTISGLRRAQSILLLHNN